MSSTPTGPPAFERHFAAVDPLPGWLTEAQARLLWDEVRALPARPRVLEVGSHHGRSTMVLAGARDDVEVVAVDPFVGGKFGGSASRSAFESNVAAFGLGDRVRLLVARSDDVRAAWTEPLDLVYVDGKHDARSTTHDLRWAEHLRPGGRVLVHDAFSSVGVTLALLRHLLPGSRLRYLGRVGSLAAFDREPPDRSTRLRLLGELPWWLRNVVVKVLLRLRLRWAAGRLGHHDTWDPF